jgi:hypothetical protein
MGGIERHGLFARVIQVVCRHIEACQAFSGFQVCAEQTTCMLPEISFACAARIGRTGRIRHMGISEFYLVFVDYAHIRVLAEDSAKADPASRFNM